MMFWFYLLLAVQMTDGKPAPTEAVPFASWEDCNREGLIRGAEKAKQSDVKDVLWSCISVDFTPDDQVPMGHPPLLPDEPPQPAKKNDA